MGEPNYFAVRAFRQELPRRFSDYPLLTDRDGYLCRRLIAKAPRILEVGAGDRPLEPELRSRGFAGCVRTMDIERSQPFDYYSLDEISETFDAIVMREVIEHLPRELFYDYLDKIGKLLEPGGELLITTPNPWAPGWTFADYTHISPWPPADLYGVLRWHGFGRVEIHRIIWPSRFLWLKRAYWAIHSRLYDLDFAGSYLAIAMK